MENKPKIDKKKLILNAALSGALVALAGPVAAGRLPGTEEMLVTAALGAATNIVGLFQRRPFRRKKGQVDAE